MVSRCNSDEMEIGKLGRGTSETHRVRRADG